MGIAKRCLVILFLLLGCVGCDQTTKSIAQSYLSQVETMSLLGDTVRLQLAFNPGAFLGLGASLPEFWRQVVFNVCVGILLLGLLGYALFSSRITPAGVIATVLIIAGGISNLADRLAYDGYVVDFINLGVGPLRTGIFNIADIFIAMGALVIVANAAKTREDSL